MILGLLSLTEVKGLPSVLKGESPYMEIFFMPGSAFHCILLFLVSWAITSWSPLNSLQMPLGLFLPSSSTTFMRLQLGFLYSR